VILLIKADHLYKQFGETLAVNDLSLSVAAGEIYGLMGPDGAGKTTAIRLLCGALLPQRRAPVQKDDDAPPSILVAGYDMLRQTEQARTKIGYLPQRFSLYDDLTVLENIRFFSEVRGLKPSEWRPRCMEILAFVGLDEYIDRRAGHLSGGMRQKLGLAAALVHQPSVLLLDEPTTGVDPVTRQDFWQLIIRLIGSLGDGQDTAVLVSTPYMDEAARCTRVGFIHHGRLVAEDAPARLCAGMQGRVLELVGHPLPLLRRLVQADEGVEDVQMFGDRLHLRVRLDQSEAVVQRLTQTIPAQGGQVESLRPISAGLEDVFMSLVER
jgi:ABC-2 type transport system ATP-binding protein